MERFFKTIVVNGVSLEFSFFKIHSVRGHRYYITVLENQKPLLFQMEKKNDNWQIIDAPKVPKWIHDIKDQLINAIVEKSG